MSAVVTELISIIVSGISSLGQGIASGMTSTVTALFLTGNGTTENPYALSSFGGVIAVFAAVSLAVGLTTLVVKWVMSLGSRN